MKILLKQKFLPVDYSRDIRSSFQNLKQESKTVVEYFEQQKKRWSQNMGHVKTWIKMKVRLKQKFLPVNYSRDMRSSFQNLKQKSKTIVEYFEGFMTIQSRCGLNETINIFMD